MLVTVYNPGFSEPKVRSFKTSDIPGFKVFFAFDVPSHLFGFMKQLPEYVEADKRVYAIQETVAHSLAHKTVAKFQQNFDLVVSSQKDISVDIQCPLIHTLLGETWCKPQPYEVPKTFSVSYLPGKKSTSSLSGYQMREDVSRYILANRRKFPFRMDYYDPSEYITSKDVIFDGVQFSIVIENNRRLGYITEKLLDCISRRTVPIYNGAPDVREYFDSSGIITFENLGDLNHKLQLINRETYATMLPHIEKNFNKLSEIQSVKINGSYRGGIYLARVIRSAAEFFRASL